MLMVVKKNLKLLGAYFKLNLSASMEYRTSFLIQVFGMALNNASFAFFWWLLFEKVGDIGGYGFDDVMLLWAFASTGFGLMFVLFGNAIRLCEMILKGEIDAYMLQPQNVCVNVVASKSNISGWGDISYGLLLFFLIRGLDVTGFLLFILFSVTAGLLFTSVIVTFNSLAFHFGNVSALANLAFEFTITLSIYPTIIYKGLIRFIIFTVLPAGFATMIPAIMIKSFDLKWLFAVLGMTVLWLIIAFWTFNSGLKRYESGNLIVQKM